MSNKINGIGTGQIGNGVNRPNGVKAGDDRAAAPTGVSNDSTTVRLTDSAQQLRRLDEALAALPDVDATKVESIKSAIASGDYEIDTHQLAEAILKFDQGLD